MSWTCLVLQQQQNLGQRFGTSKMHLSPPVAKSAVSSLVMALLLLICCLLLLPWWESVIVLCFVVRYFMSNLVLQSSWWGRESWLLCLVCLPGVVWLFLTVPWGCLQFVIAVFPVHTHLLYLQTFHALIWWLMQRCFSLLHVCIQFTSTCYSNRILNSKV